jgi:predicted acylesterase/phospholipase RssA
MSSTKRANLALQGGGSNGAFTWGELGSMAVVSPSSLDISARFL